MSEPLKNNTAVLVLQDGTVFRGTGFGATGEKVGEVCFNTSHTGYQEILTDPSYTGQIITFTFPHVGNVGTNPEDIETNGPAAYGLVMREEITNPSNYRAKQHFNDWLIASNVIGISGIDTRALTRRIRDQGAPNGVIAHDPRGEFDIEKLIYTARTWPGLNGMDLAKEVTTHQTYKWDQKLWAYGAGHEEQQDFRYNIVAIDYGAKQNILRSLASMGCDLTVVNAKTSAEKILKMKPDGIFLSNGPGDPQATGEYAVPIIQELMKSGIPMFGICLGHQLMALALGAKTEKMVLGHRGGNHPVKDLATGKVEITSQNHGFVVKEETLPKSVEVTHISLFDKTNEGLRVKDKPIFSVQYHPEASPGPHDAHYLFERFIGMIDA